MTQHDFLAHIADAIQRDESLTPDMPLNSIEEYDSLAIVSLIALFENLFAMQVSGNALHNCKSVSDIIALAQDKLEG